MNEQDVFLFPTKITVIENFLSKEECNKVLEEAKRLDTQPHNALQEGSSYHWKGDFLENIQSIDLRDRLDKLMARLTNNHGFNYYGLSSSWFNIQKANSGLHEHTHPSSQLSVALYLQVNEHSSPLTFRNPNPFIHFSNYINFDDFNYSYHNIKPKIGLLLVFPSWLQHLVTPNNEETIDRIVVSFNTKN